MTTTPDDAMPIKATIEMMPHYKIGEIEKITDLRAMFPDGQANDLNFVLFSTSGIHGHYSTLEDIEEEMDREEHTITVLVVRPRIVSLLYGNLKIQKANIPWLKKLRKSSHEVISKIGIRPRADKPHADAKTKYIAEIDEAELACRMVEAGGRLIRPGGKSAKELLSAMDQIDRDIWIRCARAAMNYWKECIDDANRTN